MEIRKLHDEDIQSYVNIISNAYPEFNFRTSEDKEKLKNRLLKIQNEALGISFYGFFKDEKMLGGMRLHDFVMNYDGIDMAAGGVGLLAVDLCHKKEKVAKELITGFIEHYRNRGANIALLYPFRPDFYKSMGFGYGTKINQYKVRPCDLPKGTSKEKITYLYESDKIDIFNCYKRIYKKTHGFIQKNENDIKALFNNPDNVVVGMKDKSGITGYMVFTFKKVCDNGLINDIVVKEIVYESREAFLEMSCFLNSQNDQINRIVFNTHDDNLHLSFADVRDGSNNLIPSVYHECNTQGVGLMYRIINTRGFFKEAAGHNFNNQSCRLKIKVLDSLIPDNAESIIVDFKEGHPHLSEGCNFEVEICLDIAEFSSLVMGVVDFETLYEYGLAEISDSKYTEKVSNIFKTSKKPTCVTAF